MHADLPGDLKAAFAYTLDGAHLGEIVYETFSADGAKVNIKGVSIHPGWAKDKLVNATHLAAKIVDTLPQATLTPETTSGRQGFLHIVGMSGSAAEMNIDIILRDFERDLLASQGELLNKVCAAVQAGEPRAQITCTITPQYRNMRYWLEDDMRPVELAREACRQIGVEPFLRARPRRHRRLTPDRAGPARRPMCSPACRRSTGRWNGSACRTWRPRPRCASSWCSYGRRSGRARRNRYAARNRRPVRAQPSIGRMRHSMHWRRCRWR